MQVYYQKDDAAGFSEPASVRRTLDGDEPTTCRFALPEGAYRALRFDPMQGPGTAQFTDARLVDRSTGVVRCLLPVSTWQPENEIAHAGLAGGSLEVLVGPGSIDPILSIPLPEHPLILRQSRTPRIAWTAVALAAILGAALALDRAGARRSRRGGEATAAAGLRRTLERAVPPGVLPLDRGAVAFLGGVVALCAVSAALGIHGSSSAARAGNGFPEGDWRPLLGTAKPVRADEWNLETPILLHQANKADPFSIPSIAGPDNAVLIANAPVRHWSMVFRPQLLPFFLLSPPKAFAWYWQFKHGMLLIGTFLAFLLLTRSSPLAALGALWFHLSAYTQWAFSWPAPLPEMIGVTCLAVVAACLVFATPSRLVAVACVLVIVGCLANFTFVSYPPFQIPIAWAGAGLWLAWFLPRWREHRSARAGPVDTPSLRLAQGASGLLLAFIAAACIAMTFLHEIRDLVEITRQTVYPGNRSVPGGSVTWAQLMSAFVDFSKSEGHSPPQFMNICEGSGYLWLAPLTVLLTPLLPRPPGRGLVMRATWILWVPALLLLAWMVLPIPAGVGRLLLLDKVLPWRITPALGLLNIAITLLFLASLPAPSEPAGAGRRRWLPAVVACGAAAGCFGLLVWMNHALDGFFPRSALAIGGVITGLAAWAIAHGSINATAAVVLAPLVWCNLLINPVDRGLPVFERSAMRAWVDAHPELKDGRWLVVADDSAAAQYFGALGLNVFNTLHFVPELDTWARFDPGGDRRPFYNGAGTTVVRLLPPGTARRIAAVPESALGPPIVRGLWIAPDDPALTEIGIRYLAVWHDVHADDLPTAALERLTPQPVDGFLVYRLRNRAP